MQVIESACVKPDIRPDLRLTSLEGFRESRESKDGPALEEAITPAIRAGIIYELQKIDVRKMSRLPCVLQELEKIGRGEESLIEERLFSVARLNTLNRIIHLLETGNSVFSIIDSSCS